MPPITDRLIQTRQKAIVTREAAYIVTLRDVQQHAIYDEDTSNLDLRRRGRPHRVHLTEKSDHIVGRLIVRRIPELNKNKLAGQATLFDLHRFHAFFTTSTLDLVPADKTHHAHAAIELVNADLKSRALADMPSGVFAANAAWPVPAIIAFNLTRAAATLVGTGLTRATTATIRRKLINIPAGDRLLSPAYHAPPARELAPGNRLDPPLRSRLRTTQPEPHLTRPP